MRLSINKWNNFSYPTIRSITSKMIAKFEKYWSNIHKLLVVVVVLDPRYKMKLVDFYFLKIYKDNASEHL